MDQSLSKKESTCNSSVSKNDIKGCVFLLKLSQICIKRVLEELSQLKSSCEKKEMGFHKKNTEALFLEGSVLFSLLIEDIKAPTETGKEKNQDK